MQFMSMENLLDIDVLFVMKLSLKCGGTTCNQCRILLKIENIARRFGDRK